MIESLSFTSEVICYGMSIKEPIIIKNIFLDIDQNRVMILT